MLKKSKLIITIALIFLLCFASISTAFANDSEWDGVLHAEDQDTPVQVAISKMLRLPSGTTIPTTTFNFIADPVSVEGDLTKDGPELKNLTVSFTSASDVTSTSDDNIMSVVLETGNIFAGVTFPHAGIYVYDITEEPNTNPSIDEDNPDESLTYSTAKYRLTVYVANHSNGSRYVSMVTAEVTTDNTGDSRTGKINPSPGGGEQDSFSQMIFKNNYLITPDDLNPATDSTLFVSKVVAGDHGNREQYFSFTINLNVPNLGQDIEPSLRGYVVENGAVVSTITSNADSELIDADAKGSYIQISTDAPTTFRLKHGQRLVFVDTPVGTRYTVTEAAAPNYTPSVVVTTNGATPGDGLSEESGESLSTGTRFVGETINGNSAAFTNTRDTIVPTGLNLNDLPFILLIALGIGALTVYIVVKTRKGKAE
jgi:hypothetical protein